MCLPRLFPSFHTTADTDYYQAVFCCSNDVTFSYSDYQGKLALVFPRPVTSPPPPFRYIMTKLIEMSVKANISICLFLQYSRLSLLHLTYLSISGLIFSYFIESKWNYLLKFLEQCHHSINRLVDGQKSSRQQIIDWLIVSDVFSVENIKHDLVSASQLFFASSCQC